MYDEDSYFKQITWLKIKRIFLIILLTIIGLGLGIVLSAYLVDVLLFNAGLRILLVAIPTLVFFALSLLITSGIAKEVQDSYWRIAVLRKMTLISKKLDSLNSLDNLSSLNINDFDEPKKVKKSKKQKNSIYDNI